MAAACLVFVPTEGDTGEIARELENEMGGGGERQQVSLTAESLLLLGMHHPTEHEVVSNGLNKDDTPKSYSVLGMVFYIFQR